MINRPIGIAALLTLLICSPAQALDYYLQHDLGVHGLFHICQYSNGRNYSFNATDLCPMQVHDDAPPATSAPPQRVGYKKGEQQDGMTKVCIYDVMGTEEAIRIGATTLCPLTHNF
jgi:hypothetical protein